MNYYAQGRYPELGAGIISGLVKVHPFWKEYSCTVKESSVQSVWVKKSAMSQ